jgi:TPR repeat protein
MLFEKAVAQGDPSAMYDLAYLYQDGKGVAQSFEKTFELWTMAAEQGYVKAMTCLGVLYFQGQGVDQSNELARAWWTKSVDEGSEDAVANLKMLDKREATSITTSNTTTTTNMCWLKWLHRVVSLLLLLASHPVASVVCGVFIYLVHMSVTTRGQVAQL